MSKEILSKVLSIVESGKDIDFLRELGADEKDLKLRQKNLLKFVEGLQKVKASPRKRTPPLENIGLIGIYTAQTFLSKSNIKKIKTITVPEKIKQQIFGNSMFLGKKEDFFLDFSSKPDLT